jgi:hypothetical protein
LAWRHPPIRGDHDEAQREIWILAVSLVLLSGPVAPPLYGLPARDAVLLHTVAVGYWKSSSSAAINNCHNVRIIAASQFNQHEQETPNVRVLFTPY